MQHCSKMTEEKEDVEEKEEDRVPRQAFSLSLCFFLNNFGIQSWTGKRGGGVATDSCLPSLDEELSSGKGGGGLWGREAGWGGVLSASMRRRGKGGHTKTAWLQLADTQTGPTLSSGMEGRGRGR